MAPPPGREPIAVPGIDASTNPRLAETAGELAAWIDYLLHPESNDGPRIYRPRHPETAPDATDFESPRRLPPADRDSPYEDPAEYETQSVLQDYAGDPSVFFKAAQAVCGISTEQIEPTFEKVAQGCLTWSNAEDARASDDDKDDEDDEDQDDDKRKAVLAEYPELHPARGNWESMRKTWTAPEDLAAREFEKDYIRFQVYTENCLYAVAEHLVRYRAIVHKAGEDIHELMKAMVAMCPKPAPPGEGTFNLMSVVVTGLVAVATTVISGGATAVAVMGIAVTEMLGEGIKTAERKVPEQEFSLENHYYLRDTAEQYLAAVEKIEKETAQAVQDLRDHLRRELDRRRDDRQYTIQPESTELVANVPTFAQYL